MTHNPSELNKNPIQRRILHAGTGSLPDYNEGDRVTFHYKTLAPNVDALAKLKPSECDDLLGESYSVVVDDSRHMGPGKPMQLLLGKQFKLVVWERCVQTMLVGEVSAFLCDTNYCIPYPLISKTLRNVSQGKESHSSHCCGQQLMAEGVGYDDLNAFMKKPQPLIFILDLLSVEAAGTYDKEQWYMDESERSVSADRLRAQGNELYQSGQYSEAGDRYREALAHLESLALREKPGETEWLEIEERKVPLLLNYSQCLLKLEDYYQVIEHTSSVLNRHPDNMKALFRRGCAYVQIYEPESAERDLNRVKSLEACDEGTRRAVDRQLTVLAQEGRKKHAQDASMFKGKLLAK